MPTYVTISKFAELSGYTETAIRQKKSNGIWPEGIWVEAPDGRILINQEEYDKWVIRGKVSKQQVRQVSKLVSPITASGAENVSNSSPPPLT